MKCQCEHEAHEAPCGNEATEILATDYGLFHLCEECVEAGHMMLEINDGRRRLTAQEYRDAAAAGRKRSADSFERSDTDGFMSQWANDINAELNDRLASLAENNWRAHFEHLYTLDGRRVNAKMIRTRSYPRRLVWAVMDPNGKFTGEFINAHLLPKNLAKKGYQILDELAPAYAELKGSGTGLAGAMSVRVVTVRTDGRG